MVLSAQKQARPALSGRSVAELKRVIKDRLRSAVQALATDQPNLASLYMKRVLEHVAELRFMLAVSKANANAEQRYDARLLEAAAPPPALPGTLTSTVIHIKPDIAPFVAAMQAIGRDPR